MMKIAIAYLVELSVKCENFKYKHMILRYKKSLIFLFLIFFELEIKINF